MKISLSKISVSDPDMAAKASAILLENVEKSLEFSNSERFFRFDCLGFSPLGPDRILLTVSRNGLSDISLHKFQPKMKKSNRKSWMLQMRSWRQCKMEKIFRI